uniref:F-box domain and ankyrin repeat protein n=1 Tax=Pithovirus LCPAC304 TaxID=2506594 RepID=A0A481ZAI6_9VIRU|nr:MAG: F-box domain and ankyrin repeat protein [Pithovirus LCPAC304]
MEAESHLFGDTKARLNRILEENPTVDMLKELPPEMQMYVAVQLRYPDVLRFCATSTEAKRVCSTDYFWKLKIEHDFPKKAVGTEGKRREMYNKHWQDAQEKILECARLGHLKCIESSIQLGIDLNFQTKKGETDLMTPGTALMGAAGWGHADIVQMLLEHGADPNIKNSKGFTALMYPSVDGDADMVRLLLEHNANPNLRNQYGEAALYLATEERGTDVVRLLLEHNADPDLQTLHEWTAIMEASRYGQTEIVRLLLNADADPQGALYYASRHGHADIVALLSDKS